MSNKASAIAEAVFRLCVLALLVTIIYELQHVERTIRLFALVEPIGVTVEDINTLSPMPVEIESSVPLEVEINR